jgi:hypothetical protein
LEHTPVGEKGVINQNTFDTAGAAGGIYTRGTREW